MIDLTDENVWKDGKKRSCAKLQSRGIFTSPIVYGTVMIFTFKIARYWLLIINKASGYMTNVIYPQQVIRDT